MSLLLAAGICTCWGVLVSIQLAKRHPCCCRVISPRMCWYTGHVSCISKEFSELSFGRGLRLRSY